MFQPYIGDSRKPKKKTALMLASEMNNQKIVSLLTTATKNKHKSQQSKKSSKILNVPMNLVDVAHDTLHILNDTKKYTIDGKTVDISEQIANCIEGTILYKPDESFDSQIRRRSKKRRGHITITNETTIHASIRLVKELNIPEEEIVALNFASARTPGGGLLRGRSAQEESLCRQSSLYASINQAKVQEMYKYNATLEGPLCSDYIIYTPKAVIFRDDNLQYLSDPVLTSIITSPAANLRLMREEDTIDDVHASMTQRIRKIIQIAIVNNNKSIILGAFGCGYFANDPNDVSNYFYKVLIEEKYIDFFDEVVFAIYKSKYNSDAFKETFNDVISS